MRLIKCPLEFFTLIDPIEGDDAKDYSICPDLYDGMFFEDRKQELLDYCAKNPGFHIATDLDRYTTVNRYVETGRSFYLCCGDPDPELVFFFQYSYDRKKESEVSELDEDELFSVRNEFLSRRNS